MTSSQSQHIGEPYVMSEESVEPAPAVRRATKFPPASTIIDPESPALENGLKSLL